MGNLIPIDQANSLAERKLSQTTPTIFSNHDRQILEAHEGTLIQNATEIELKQVILASIGLSGVNPSNSPDKASIALLIDFLLSNYGTMTLKEIKTAFSQNAAGQLSETFDHFQNFSAMFVGKVLTAYRKKVNDLHKQLDSSREWNKPIQPLTHSKELSDEWMVQTSYEHYQKIGNWQTIYPGCYPTLKRHNLGFTDQDEFNHRVKFNEIKSSDKDKAMFPETTTRQFHQWLSAKIFTDLIQKNTEKVFPFEVFELLREQNQYFQKHQL